jgi:hypothetical protein
MPISTEGQALLDAAQACTDQTEVSVTAINNHNTHVAETAKHIDWSVAGVEELNLSRFPIILDGEEGDSAYDVAVTNGFIGSESDWILSLYGADGVLNLTRLDYSLRALLRTPASNPSSNEVVMITNLGKFQYNATFDFVDDDETAFQVLDSADGVTPIGQWVMTVPAIDFSESQKLFENAVLWERWEDEEIRHIKY